MKSCLGIEKYVLLVMCSIAKGNKVHLYQFRNLFECPEWQGVLISMVRRLQCAYYSMVESSFISSWFCIPTIAILTRQTDLTSTREEMICGSM